MHPDPAQIAKNLEEMPDHLAGVLEERGRWLGALIWWPCAGLCLWLIDVLGRRFDWLIVPLWWGSPFLLIGAFNVYGWLREKMTDWLKRYAARHRATMRDWR